MLETFNTGYQLNHIIGPLSQEEILNTPGFFALSLEQILNSGRCPAHLRRVLLDFNWVGRPNFIQVRIQDYRKAEGFTLGGAWHVDANTVLANGRMHLAKSLSEFRSMTASFGDVRETEFAVGPIAVDTAKVDPFNHGDFAGFMNSQNPKVVKALPGQLAVYTGRDAHRAGPSYRIGNVRLMIVTVECDEPLEEGAGGITPSLAEIEK